MSLANAPYAYEMRKPRRWFSTNPLSHLCMVTYAVPPERVLPLVPQALELDTRFDSEGAKKAFVSAVIFLNDRIRLLPTPWPHFTFLQVNYRTYVHREGVPGVWFFKLMQHSRMAGFNRRVFGAPTYYAPMEQRCNFDGRTGRYKSYSFHSEGNGHSLHLETEEAGASRHPSLAGLFSSLGEMEVFLTSRPDGYFRGARKGGITKLTIWHKLLRPAYAQARRAEFSLFSDLGLVDIEAQQEPLCVMLLRKTVLLGQLPTRLPSPEG